MQQDIHFHFYKHFTQSNSDFNWCGNKIKFFNENDTIINIEIQFDFLLNTEIQFKYTHFGIKTHEPMKYYFEWLKTCKLHSFTNIILPIQIYKKNQFVIFNFDKYLHEIDFEIKNFKIIQ